MLPDFVINVEFVSSLVCKLKWGKAAGYDRLTAERIAHAHPILIVLLSLLFQMLVLHEFCPLLLVSSPGAQGGPVCNHMSPNFDS